MKKVIVIFITLISLFLITGCGTNEKEYLGKWIFYNKEKQDYNYYQTFEITKNEKQYLVNVCLNAPFSEGINYNPLTKTFTASYNDKTGNLDVDDGGFTTPLIYTKEGDYIKNINESIFFTEGIYKRMTPEIEKEQQKKVEELKERIKKNKEKNETPSRVSLNWKD